MASVVTMAAVRPCSFQCSSVGSNSDHGVKISGDCKAQRKNLSNFIFEEIYRSSGSVCSTLDFVP